MFLISMILTPIIRDAAIAGPGAAGAHGGATEDGRPWRSNGRSGKARGQQPDSNAVSPAFTKQERPRFINGRGLSSPCVGNSSGKPTIATGTSAALRSVTSVATELDRAASELEAGSVEDPGGADSDVVAPLRSSCPIAGCSDAEGEDDGVVIWEATQAEPGFDGAVDPNSTGGAADVGSTGTGAFPRCRRLTTAAVSCGSAAAF